MEIPEDLFWNKEEFGFLNGFTFFFLFFFYLTENILYNLFGIKNFNLCVVLNSHYIKGT
jgi:hypothetical protein